MLIYRLISWLMLAAIGWLVFFFMFRRENDLDLDGADHPDWQLGHPRCTAISFQATTLTKT